MDLLNAVSLSNNELYVFIDDYDVIINEALKNKVLLKALTSHHKNEVNFIKAKLGLIESLYKQFFTRLKTACDESIAYVFLTGVTSITLTESTSEEILSWLKKENDGYIFSCNQTEGIFNTAHILYCIKIIMEQKKKLNNKDPSIICNTLLNFPSNSQILPLQMILNLIINNPLGKSILIEALNQHSLNSPNGIGRQFQLTNIRELTIHRTSLLSFMFYNGAITYQPNPSPASLQHNFQIPNHIIKKEFITEAFKIYNWKIKDLIPVQNYLQILETKYNIEPLCEFIEKVLLKLLKNDNIIHSNEEILRQVFMDTLILILHADIKPKFQVYS
ncbi:hypothetical protein RclHR1_00860028 [Rhizophagus clarus]|uniref:AAA family ATPase n=1 Tax=Rhizophagus clarus TaxID=94130 RepID=A0A2Z6SFM8_9GLOM|nr:hypothetical protein RclHR1_00860028 [Rhizophagus clarus]GES86047.1 AAA family ATPase [Rhizophagus clarus]